MNKILKSDRIWSTVAGKPARVTQLTLRCWHCQQVFTRIQWRSRHRTDACGTCLKRISNARIFYKKAFSLFRGLFKYTSKYVASNIKITIHCTRCGSAFKQLPSAHLLGDGGCPTCAINTTRSKLTKPLAYWEDLLAENFKHISLVDIPDTTKRKQQALFRCSIHGEFSARLEGIRNHKHLCLYCANEATSFRNRCLDTKEPALIYLVFFPSISMWKLGVTKFSLQQRFSSLSYPPFETVWSIQLPTQSAAYKLEMLLFRKYSTFRYREPKKLIKNGNTELLYHPIDKPEGF